MAAHRPSALGSMLLLAMLALIPASTSADPIDDLDHLTLDPYISNAGEKPVLIEFYAPWCSHCRNFAEEYAQVGATLEEEAHVARVDGSAHRVLTSRFRVRGFPSFFLVRAGKVTEYAGERTHNGLVNFVRTGGDADGQPLESFTGGPLSPYWRGVRAMFAAANALRVAAEDYKDRPVTLFCIAFGAAMSLVALFAIVIFFVTKPSLPPPSARASQQQRPHAE